MLTGRNARGSARLAAGARRALPGIAAAWLLLAGSMLGAACGPGTTGGDPDSGVIPDDGFPDFTQPTIDDVAAFEALAKAGPSSRSVKFLITAFRDPTHAGIRWYDSAKYQLHDEWYWFRLLNGHAIPGLQRTDHPAEQPVTGLVLKDIPTIYAWAGQQALLPLDLRFLGERLYSQHFYDLALFADPKQMSLGTLVRFPEREEPAHRDEIWGFELEYQDASGPDGIAEVFRMIESSVPRTVAEQLRWIVRSPAQELTAQQMQSEGLPYADRVLRYGDLTIPGDVEVYSEGLVAGRLKIIRSGEGGLEDTRATDILVVEEPPDFLPQCSGLITAVPQTPLAHVNVLAKNRGIPNAYVAGILDDPNLDQLARVAAPVVVKARGPNSFEIVAMTEADFAHWRQLTAVQPSAVTPVDVPSLPYTYDLEAESFADADLLRPRMGGKAVGYLAVCDADVVRPPDPMALSIRAYVEHTASLRPRLQAMIADPTFQTSVAVRILVLEGEAFYDEAFPTPADETVKRAVLVQRPTGDVLRSLVEEGGVRAVIAQTPIEETTLSTIEEALNERYAAYADDQPLRFRSSSNVEDVEGFNGAGLYESFSGYLHADRLDDARAAKTVEAAIKKTWGSYWRAEAFEERSLARIDHLSGAMGLVIHASFQDVHERSNGVLFSTILPPESDDAARMELNVQRGALSVTNPDGTTELPEVDVVVRAKDGAVRVERVSPSTLSAPGEHVLSDDELIDLFEQSQRIVDLWLTHLGEDLLTAQRPRTLTLDMEFRDVFEGWPALANGNSFGPRRVLKQARTVEPTLARIPAAVLLQPMPRDVLSRARRVERMSCASSSLLVSTVDAYTDPLLPPVLGYETAPFTGLVSIELLQDIPGIAAAGARMSAVHLSFASVAHPSLAAGGGWDLDVVVDPARAAASGFSRVTIGADGALSLTDGDVVHTEPAGSMVCTPELLFATPQDFLEGVLRTGP